MYRKVSMNSARALPLQGVRRLPAVREDASLALPPARANLIPDASDGRQRTCRLHTNHSGAKVQ